MHVTKLIQDVPLQRMRHWSVVSLISFCPCGRTIWKKLIDALLTELVKAAADKITSEFEQCSNSSDDCPYNTSGSIVLFDVEFCVPFDGNTFCKCSIQAPVPRLHVGSRLKE